MKRKNERHRITKALFVDLLNGVRKEEQRSREFLHLTAHENRLSKVAHSFLSSPLSFRQHEGTLEDHCVGDVIEHGSFVLMGLPGIYKLELEAREAAQHMFHADVSDFRPTSGIHGMLCTLAAGTDPGDLVYTIDPRSGGHSATRHILNRMGRRNKYIPWSNDNFNVDLNILKKEVNSAHPKAIFLEHGTPLFSLPLKEIREIVGEETLIVYDASHTLGLIAGGQFQDPLREGCNILQGNLHKTFPGPQKAMINFRDRECGDRISKSISAGLVSSQHTHHAIAAYITTLEMAVHAESYALQMIENAQVLASQLAGRGIELLSRDGVYTRSHQILLRGSNMDEKCRRLLACGISANARFAFGQRVIRIGVQEVTRRGMKASEMCHIALLIRQAVDDSVDPELTARQVRRFNRDFTRIEYSFDDEMGMNNKFRHVENCSFEDGFASIS